jgi:superfamily II DNA/RNA helicase
MNNNNNNNNDFFQNYEINRELNFYDSFEDPELKLKDNILNGVYNYGFEKPSQIQRVAIKPIIDGEDMVIQSHSGTGKTATFIIGLLYLIDENLNEPQAIIISNTRELADQTFKVCNNLSRFTKIKSNLCIGGDMQFKYYSDSLKDHIIIGTPGRISDLVNKNIINTSNIKIIIVDEADDVLSNSFMKQVKKIFSRLPDEAQVILISATIPTEMSSLFDAILKPNFITIFVKDNDLTLDGIKQYYINIDEQNKVDALMDLYKFISIGQAIVYCNKKYKADELRQILEENNYSISILHGDMIQKEREEIMNEFRQGKTRILITTDILSRGIDIQQVSLVINYDMPKYPQTYIHRIGRSGRYGRKGSAINFVTKKEKNILNFIRKMYNTEIVALPNNVSELL